MAVKADTANKKNSRGRRILIRSAVTGALIGLPLVAITGTASAASFHGNNSPQGNTSLQANAFQGNAFQGNNTLQANIWQNTPTQQSDWTYHHDHDADHGTNWFHQTFPTFQGTPPAPTVVYVAPAPSAIPSFANIFGTGSG